MLPQHFPHGGRGVKDAPVSPRPAVVVRTRELQLRHGEAVVHYHEGLGGVQLRLQAARNKRAGQCVQRVNEGKSLEAACNPCVKGTVAAVE